MNWMRTGFILIFVGFALIFIAVSILSILFMVSGGVASVSGVGCIVILFIPICFGYGVPSLLIPLMIISVVLVIALLIIGYLMLRDIRKNLRKIGEAPSYL
ncbi:MAG: hypothetical protein LM582_04835 [Desulfurococcaceae archaeon]|jgi:uncharacterized membrane protein|nr:hypothetical protein [Desulfurococcaceae archaeon]MCC6057322.1 hypothetical protein [Desulfurococcaceae archaeon]